MNYKRFAVVLLLAAVFLFTGAGTSSSPVTAQKERPAESKKRTQFHYVCPMHENVTSKSRGTCRKCKMKLVRKPIVKEKEPEESPSPS